MKKALKLFGFIVLVAVIWFSTVSCGDDDDGGGGGSGGNIIASGAEVVYDIYNDEFLAEAKNITDFGYSYINGGYNPLSIALDGLPSVTVKNNKVTIILGTPKYFENMDSQVGAGVSVNPSGAWGFFIQSFCPNGRYYLTRYYLTFKKYNNGYLDYDYNGRGLQYVDRDVTINGTYYDNRDSTTIIWKYNISLKKGWNYIIWKDEYNTRTVTSSTTLPSGFKWTMVLSKSEY